MKRSAPLVRKTALRRVTPLTTARQKARAERTPQQQRRAAWEAAFAAAKVVVRRRSGGRCEYPGDDCEQAADEFHHKLAGSKGHAHPRCNDPDFILHVCSHHHHEVIHKYPERAYLMGTLLRYEEVPA